MIGLEDLTDLVSLVIWTGQVEGERPASMILIAPPGAGKTSVLEKFASPQAPFMTDLTTRELSAMLSRHKDATHIILADMLSMLNHKKSTTSLTLRMISTLTGEEAVTDSFSGESIAGRSLGLVTAIPPEDLKQPHIQEHLNAGGFASRFILARYMYRTQTISAIHQYIREDKYTKHKKTLFKIDNRKLAVTISDEIAFSIQNLAVLIKADPLGTRMHHHLRALVKARARREGRTEATADDLQAIQSYADFFHSEGRLL